MAIRRPLRSILPDSAEIGPKKNTVTYVAPWEFIIFINDPGIATLSGDPLKFLSDKAVEVPIGDLTELWLNAGIIHNSITSLSHSGKEEDHIYIRWSKKLKAGVQEYSSNARNFNERIKYPNVRWTGIWDFEHIRKVLPSIDLPHSRNWDNKKNGCEILNAIEGIGFFAKSIAETIILAIHTALINRINRWEIAPTILKTLCKILKYYGSNSEKFVRSWDLLQGDNSIEDVELALSTNVLHTHRFVGLSERYVFSLEGWL